MNSPSVVKKKILYSLITVFLVNLIKLINLIFCYSDRLLPIWAQFILMLTALPCMLVIFKIGIAVKKEVLSGLP
jgi:hypothetical protein